jgi:hypothetical protein
LDDLRNLPSLPMMAEGARKEWLTVGFELRTSRPGIIQNSQSKELSALGAKEAKVIFAFLPLHGFDGLIALGRNVNRARHFPLPLAHERTQRGEVLI